jgi:hypothetical protein
MEDAVTRIGKVAQLPHTIYDSFETTISTSVRGAMGVISSGTSALNAAHQSYAAHQSAWFHQSAQEHDIKHQQVKRELEHISLCKVLELDGISMHTLCGMTTEAETIEFVEKMLTQSIGRLLFDVVSRNTERRTMRGLSKYRGSQVKTETTRGKFRQTLAQLIGSPPNPSERSWRDDFTPAMQEGMATLGLDMKNFPHRASPELYRERHIKNGVHQKKLEVGFSEDGACCLEAVTSKPIGLAVGRALEEGSSRYAALTHSVYNTIATQAAAGEVAPKCYIHLHGLGTGLADMDERWLQIERPDQTGFCGMTLYTPLALRKAVESKYDPGGLKAHGGKTVVDSPVICIESTALEESMFHSMVYTGANTVHSRGDQSPCADQAFYMLPPLTLVEVVDVQKGPFEYLPGMFVNQKLITVRPTYLIATKTSKASLGMSKFACDYNFLEFGTTDSMVRGITDITNQPVLTMEQEFSRNDTWTDWKGQTYSAWGEWEYVTKPVEGGGKEGSGFGGRDEGMPDRTGWEPAKFLEVANAAICQGAEERGLTHGMAPLMVLAEVIAIRLYTGPAYQPINKFLREVNKVGADWRKKLSHFHQLTYSSTVFHLTNGIRKLVRVNNDFTTTFRALRGQLPHGFWLRDEFGMVTATDFAFMSTSPSKEVCVSYMGDTKNVLWEIHCSREASEGFHNGADVSATLIGCNTYSPACPNPPLNGPCRCLASPR